MSWRLAPGSCSIVQRLAGETSLSRTGSAMAQNSISTARAKLRATPMAVKSVASRRCCRLDPARAWRRLWLGSVERTAQALIRIESTGGGCSSSRGCSLAQCCSSPSAFWPTSSAWCWPWRFAVWLLWLTKTKRVGELSVACFERLRRAWRLRDVSTLHPGALLDASQS